MALSVWPINDRNFNAVVLQVQSEFRAPNLDFKPLDQSSIALKFGSDAGS
jgi:hypothetical protein